MKNQFYLLFVLIVSLLFSCGKDDKNTTNVDPCNNQVITRNDSIIITGCSNYEPTLSFSNGGYILTMYENPLNALENFELYEKSLNSYRRVKSYSASALHPDGWYSQASIWTRIGGNWRWRITAKGPYLIVFAKLPLNVIPTSKPVTYNSAGTAVLGPVHLSGMTIFTANCPDAKLAAFDVQLYDATTGIQVVGADYANVLDIFNVDENNKQINNFTKEQTIDLPEGNYLMQVKANESASWSLKIN